MPSSLVRSRTEINRILPIPIIPASMVATPTIKDNRFIPFEKPMTRLKISPKLKDPKARSSSGCTLYFKRIAVLTSSSTARISTSSNAASANQLTLSPVLYNFRKVVNGINISESLSKPPPGTYLCTPMT